MTRRYHADFERPIVELEDRLEELKKHPSAHQPQIANEIALFERQIDKLRKRVYKNLTAWQRVQLARHPDRPRFFTYLDLIFHDFIELHGDRCFKDDPAIVGGLGKIGDARVVVVAHEKGVNLKDRVKRNFGSSHPEGYRKALRLYRLAGKFGLPLVTFIDTPGAYAGIGAEERGQAGAIADCLRELSDLPTPVVAVNIGEGGSGGALALGVADRVYMLENSYYSVITPEGCAAILWQEKDKAPEAAEALALTAKDQLDLGTIDEIIPEPLGGAHRDPKAVAVAISEALTKSLDELVSLPPETLIARRYEKFRRLGVVSERQGDITAGSA